MLRRGLAGVFGGAGLALMVATPVLACTNPDKGDNSASATTCPSAMSSQLKAHSYVIDGHSQKALHGSVHAGSSVTASFTVAPKCDVTLSLVSYKAPSASFSRDSASQQVVFEHQTGTFGAGEHSLTVTVPGCYYQVDFVFGQVIQHLGPASSNNFYSDQHRLIEGDNGGTTSCSTTPSPSPTPRPTATPTPRPTSTPVVTPAPTATALPTAVPTPVVTPAPTATATAAPVSTVAPTPATTPTGAVQPISTSAPASTPLSGVQGITTSAGGTAAAGAATPDTGAHIAIGLALVLAVTGLGLISGSHGLRRRQYRRS